MPKYYESAHAICLYYKDQKSNLIRCKGITDKSVLHLAFANAKDCREYRGRFCNGKPEECVLYQLLEKGDADELE